MTNLKNNIDPLSSQRETMIENDLNSEITDDSCDFNFTITKTNGSLSEELADIKQSLIELAFITPSSKT
jgi:hypothetical protein